MNQNITVDLSRVPAEQASAFKAQIDKVLSKRSPGFLKPKETLIQVKNFASLRKAINTIKVSSAKERYSGHTVNVTVTGEKGDPEAAPIVPETNQKSEPQEHLKTKTGSGDKQNDTPEGESEKKEGESEKKEGESEKKEGESEKKEGDTPESESTGVKTPVKKAKNSSKTK